MSEKHGNITIEPNMRTLDRMSKENEDGSSKVWWLESYEGHKFRIEISTSEHVAVGSTRGTAWLLEGSQSTPISNLQVLTVEAGDLFERLVKIAVWRMKGSEEKSA